MTPSDTMSLEAIFNEFFNLAPEGVILFEGLEYLISNAGFKAILRMIQQLNDKVVMMGGTIYLLIDLDVLEEKEARLLKRECSSPRE